MAMQTDEGDEVYPSPRLALLGNGHVANLRCAIKYVVWQGGWLAVAIFGAIFVAILGTAAAIYYGLTFVYNRTLGRLGVVTRTVGFFGSIARTSSETPVLRRVYSECPVEISMKPRWAERLEDWVDGL